MITFPPISGGTAVERSSTGDPRVTVATETYKRVGDLPIHLDLSIPRAGASGIVVWIHGGA